MFVWLLIGDLKKIFHLIGYHRLCWLIELQFDIYGMLASVEIHCLFVLHIRHGTISNFRSISISIFSEIWFSKSKSISKFFKKFLQYQNQYQYQNFPILNIKINIKIFPNQNSISKSMSIFSKYWYWFWKSNFFGLKVCCLTSCDFYFAWDTNTHCIMSNGTLSETHGTSPGTYCISHMN